MTVPSLTGRVVLGAVTAALLAALAGAVTAALVARGVWETRERRALKQTADGLVAAIAREASEEGATLDRAAGEALRESVTSPRRVEVWRGALLVVASPTGPTLGPPDAVDPRRDAWLVETRPAAGGLLVLVASPRAGGGEAARVVTWSLALSAPVFVVLAVLIGRFVGQRATRPLLAFRDRIAAVRPLEALPPGPLADATSEVRALETSFRALWARLGDVVSRELEFAANASHELRTPLTRIRLHAERARAAGGDGARHLDELLLEVDRMARLVDSLLVLSRDVAAGIPAPDVVNLSDVVVATARRVFAGSAAPAIDAPDEALVRGDEALLGIAVENLLDNARKFAAPGARALILVTERGRAVRLAVTSPGTRVAPDAAGRLFERFYRGPDALAARNGHGLGLPLARHVARLHGGDVRCASGPAEDARFEMELPAWAPA